MQEQRILFFQGVSQSLADGTFISLHLGANKGADRSIKSLLIRPVLVKGEEVLQCTYRHKTKDVVKNMGKTELEAFLDQHLSYTFFRYAACYSTIADVTLEYIHATRILLRSKPATKVQETTPLHNRIKKRHIEAKGQYYLHALGLTNAQGEVKRERQDKWKQIHQYIESIRPLLLRLPSKSPLKVVDMGSGKGYLTFALYDFLTTTLGRQVEMVGVEYRRELVDTCRGIARESGFGGLSFQQGSIEQYQESADVLIALHACDTATDDAIAHGIKNHAELIIVSPCCHKQVRREMEAASKEGHAKKHALHFVTRHGIFLEREAEMVTDSLRALFLEYAGYKVKVVQFIEDAHTPKNILIIAEYDKKALSPSRRDAVKEQIIAAKRFFRIGEHYLERLLDARFDAPLEDFLEDPLDDPLEGALEKR